MAIAFAGLGAMVLRPGFRRLALELLFVMTPYLLTVTHFAMWWGGFSPPARFFAPVLPLFAAPAAAAWTLATRRATRVIAVITLVMTAFASAVVVFVDRGRLAFNTRDVPSLWLEWLGRLADLTSAAPVWARDYRPAAVSRHRHLGRCCRSRLRLPSRDRRANSQAMSGGIADVAAATAIAGVMLASTLVWAVQGSTGRTSSPSQLQLLAPHRANAGCSRLRSPRRALFGSPI